MSTASPIMWSGLWLMTLIQTRNIHSNAHRARLFLSKFYSSRVQAHFSRVGSGQKVTPSCRIATWLTRVKTVLTADSLMVSHPIRKWWVICRHYPQTYPIRIMNFRHLVNKKKGNQTNLRSAPTSNLSSITQIFCPIIKVPNSYRANSIPDTNARSTRKKLWVPRQPISKIPVK